MTFLLRNKSKIHNEVYELYILRSNLELLTHPSGVEALIGVYNTLNTISRSEIVSEVIDRFNAFDREFVAHFRTNVKYVRLHSFTQLREAPTALLEEDQFCMKHPPLTELARNNLIAKIDTNIATITRRNLQSAIGDMAYFMLKTGRSRDEAKRELTFTMTDLMESCFHENPRQNH